MPKKTQGSSLNRQGISKLRNRRKVPEGNLRKLDIFGCLEKKVVWEKNFKAALG